MSFVGFNCSGGISLPDSRAPQHPNFAGRPTFALCVCVCETYPDISMPTETDTFLRRKCQSQALARGFSDEMVIACNSQDIHCQLTAQF